MRRMRRVLKLCTFFTILLITLSVGCEAKTVRLGVVSDGIFTAYDVHGEFERYDKEYLQEVATIVGWNYTYVDYDNFADALRGLQNGDIDLLKGVSRLPERADSIDYAARSSGRDLVLLMTGKRNTRMQKRDLINRSRLDVGLVNGNLSRTDAEVYLAHYGLPIIWHEYADLDALYQALDDGIVDIFACYGINQFESLPVIDYFWLNDTYYAVNKQNQLLLKELNEADDYIIEHNPGLFSDLHYGISKRKLLFSRHELDFLREHDRFKIGISADQWPRSYYDTEAKAFKGYYVDILQNIATQLGCEFEFVPLATDYKNLAEFFTVNPDVTAVFGFDDMDPEISGQRFIISKPVLTNEMQFICHKDKLPKYEAAVKVILPRDNINYENFVRTYYPAAEIELVDNIEECLIAINDRRADLSLYNAERLRNFTRQPRYQQLQLINTWTVNSHVVLVTPPDTEREFIALVDKAVSYMNSTQLDVFAVNDVLNRQSEFNLANFWYDYRIYILCFLFVWLLTLIIMYYTFRLRMAKQEHYRDMAEMSGAIFFEYDITDNRWYYSDGFERELQRKLDETTFLNSQWLHHSDVEAVRTLYRELITGQSSRMEVKARILNGNDQYVWYDIFAKLVKKDMSRKLVGNIKNIDTVMNASEQFKVLANTDRLSGLLNKTSMLEKMELYLADPKHNGGALFFIDIDNFKQVNDKMGHTIGDMAIKDISQKIQALFRENDIMGRFGGDEFFVMSQSIPNNVITERSRQLVSILRCTYINDMMALKVSASIGIATVEPGEMITVSELIEKADKAAYISKNKGKDCYTIYTDDLQFDGYEGNR